MSTMNAVIRESFEQSFSYKEYRDMMSELLADNKTTGPIQTEDYIHYTKMNDTRMKRLEKTTKVLPEYLDVIQRIGERQLWIIITEAWCGDAAQVIPVIEKMIESNSHITTYYVLRDEHPELMDMFLTNKGRSIPKIILIQENSGEVLMNWGPRPLEVQEMVEERMRSDDPEPYMEFAVKLQKWYAKDKTISIQREFSEAINASSAA